MSTWSVLALERLGTPLPSWPTIWGPADPGADPIAANSLHTLDLTPYLSPLQDFSSTLERDLTKASFGSVNLDLVDSDESLAVALGPASTTMATADRYFGPWIQITETWSTGSAVRWTGYLDETSIQWDQAAATTKATVLHASQLLRERLLADQPELLRPFPDVPLAGSYAYTCATADALLQADVSTFTPRSTADAIEANLWTMGQFSWQVATSSEDVKTWVTETKIRVHTTTYPPPAYPSLTVTIAGNTYLVDHIEWDPSIFAEVLMEAGGYCMGDQITDTRRVARIVLQGFPDLTGVLSLGETFTFGICAATLTHYILVLEVFAPVSGSDGQRWLALNTVDQLVAGDVLSITYWDTTQSVQRRSKTDVTVIDVDGETNRVWLKEPLTQGLSVFDVLRIRRDSRDPVLFDGVAYARAAVAPWALDTTYLAPAATQRPVLAWLPHNVASPHLYGLHNLQTVGVGTLRFSRRGPVQPSDNTYPLAGSWQGNWSSGFTWLGMPSASGPLEVLGDINQWPAATNTLRPPVLYIEGDLSAMAAIPINGWRHGWRTWKTPVGMIQDPDNWWDGAGIQWNSTVASTLIPACLMCFAAQTATPGRYSRLSSGGTWSFCPHTANDTLGSAITPTITGTVPTGYWLSMGMGIYAAGNEQEALLGLVTTDTAQPFTNMSAVLLSQASGGNLTVRQSLSIWTTGSTGTISQGNWALGGGLILQHWVQTIDGAVYPHTRLHKLDGTNHLTADFRTLEIIPQSIQPLALTGTDGSKTISGWYALALETYLTDSFAPARRLRFLLLGANLSLLNGDPEPDPGDPLNPVVDFRRGDFVSDYVSDGALADKLVRTGVGDAMVGFLGGRLFQVDQAIPFTVEHLKIGDPTTRGVDSTSLSAADYIEQFANTLMASAIPDATGNMRLVSRASGTKRLRTSGTLTAGVWGTERSARKTLQTYRSYISEVRITFTDAVTGDSRQSVIAPYHAGGKPISLDLSNLVGGICTANAIGEAMAFWFGSPSGVISETWVDRTGGSSGPQNPPFFAEWQIGDLVPLDPFTTGTTAPQTYYKIHSLKPDLEARSADVDLIKLPIPILGA